MRAFALDEFGQPGSIHDLPDPEPAEGQVRVRIAAASLNPFDNFVVQGHMKDRLEHRFPLVPASDLAGTVDRIGPGVTELAAGDEVFGITGKMNPGEGTLAELATASVATLARRPAAISPVEAAAMPLAAVSALMSVEAVAPAPGDLVVIVGGSGGIGSYAVQLAALEGAHVIGVTTAASSEAVRDLGAAEVLDRQAGDLLESLKSKYPDGVAAIIDTASDGPSLARLSGAVRSGGTVVSMRGAAAVDDLAQRGIKGVNIGTQVTAARLEQLAALASAGKLKAPRIQTFPLEKSAEAFALLGQSGGKLVVTI